MKKRRRLGTAAFLDLAWAFYSRLRVQLAPQLPTHLRRTECAYAYTELDLSEGI